MFERLVRTEVAAKREQFVQQELGRQLDTRAAGQNVPMSIPLPDVVQPTPAEREAHELAGHLPPKPWCEHCIMGRGTTAPQRRVPAADRDHGAPTFHLDIIRMKSDGSHVEG